MKEHIRFLWHKYYKPVYRVVAFILTGIVMVMSFPRLNMFTSEYEINRPWSEKMSLRLLTSLYTRLRKNYH